MAGAAGEIEPAHGAAAVGRPAECHGARIAREAIDAAAIAAVALQKIARGDDRLAADPAGEIESVALQFFQHGTAH